MRQSPKIAISQRSYDCTMLACGFDTFEESLSVYIFRETWAKLEEAKKYACERNKETKGKNQAYSTKFCGMDFQIKGHGGDNIAFILENPDYTITIRPAEKDFNLSITYRSCALWQYGIINSRDIIHRALMRELKPRIIKNESGEEIGWQRVSRADFAYDFHSPEFTGEIHYGIADQIVCHSSCKVRDDFKKEEINGYVMGTSGQVQTLTIGSKASVEIQIYDKTAEITEASGKTWMYKVWGQSGFCANESTKDVWRLEIRMGRGFLNNHKIDTFEDLQRNLELLLCEALTTRRLVEPSGKDTNKRRWKVHPLWGQAIELSGNHNEMLPIGKQSEQSSAVIMEKAKRDIKAAARRFVVSEVGSWDMSNFMALMNEVREEIEMDNDHDMKIEMYEERFKYKDCAR